MKSLQELDIRICEYFTLEEVNDAKLFLSLGRFIFIRPTDIDKTRPVFWNNIKRTDNTPFKEPYRQITPGMYAEVRNPVKGILDVGAIRQSQSPYSFNIVLVKKKDGSQRFCIDNRKLNSRTIKDAYNFPYIDDNIDILIELNFFTKLGLTSSYWHVEIEEKDKEKTTLSGSSVGHYECNRMGFCLTNAPVTFPRIMERCVGELNLGDCLVLL